MIWFYVWSVRQKDSVHVWCPALQKEKEKKEKRKKQKRKKLEFAREIRKTVVFKQITKQQKSN
jgi:hypothetical protein